MGLFLAGMSTHVRCSGVSPKRCRWAKPLRPPELSQMDAFGQIMYGSSSSLLWSRTEFGSRLQRSFEMLHFLTPRQTNLALFQLFGQCANTGLKGMVVPDRCCDWREIELCVAMPESVYSWKCLSGNYQWFSPCEMLVNFPLTSENSVDLLCFRIHALTLRFPSCVICWNVFRANFAELLPMGSRLRLQAMSANCVRVCVCSLGVFTCCVGLTFWNIVGGHAVPHLLGYFLRRGQ